MIVHGAMFDYRSTWSHQTLETKNGESDSETRCCKTCPFKGHVFIRVRKG